MQKRKSILAIGFGTILAVFSGAAGETVKVSQFGFDPEDSTRFVQAALDSGAKCVVFDHRGAPWIVRPLKARSNTDIVFEDGVELLAKRGEFRGKRDYLLDMSNVTNCTIRGLGEKGGVLRMHKADYQKPPYEHSEWRYALSLLGAVCVNVENMSFIASGGGWNLHRASGQRYRHKKMPLRGQSSTGHQCLQREESSYRGYLPCKYTRNPAFCRYRFRTGPSK